MLWRRVFTGDCRCGWKSSDLGFLYVFFFTAAIPVTSTATDAATDTFVDTTALSYAANVFI